MSESLNSNNANILAGLCIPALILGLGPRSGVERFAAAAMVLMTVLATVLARSGGGLTCREGGAIIALYAAFAVVVCVA